MNQQVPLWEEPRPDYEWLPTQRECEIGKLGIAATREAMKSNLRES